MNDLAITPRTMMRRDLAAVDTPRAARELRRREEIFRSILAAAERLLISKGFTAMTMDDVASEAGLCKATVYKYVPSKGRILFEIASQSLDEENEKIRRIVDSRGGAVEKLRAVIATIVSLHRAKSNIGNILMMDETHFKILRLVHQANRRAGSNNLRRGLSILRQKDLDIMKLIAGLIEDGVAAGEFRPVDPMETVSFIYSLFDGIVQPRFWQRGTLDLSDDELSEKVFAFIYASIRGDRGQARKERE
jgi:AcrR family transcriptional regulator